MKKYSILIILSLSVFSAIAQTSLDPIELRHKSFIAMVDSEDGEPNFRLQVATDIDFNNLIIDDQFISSFYATDPYHDNSPLRVSKLVVISPNTTYYYRYAYDLLPRVYTNIIEVTTWDPPETSVITQPIVAYDGITLNWTNDDPSVTGYNIDVYNKKTGCFSGSYFYDYSIGSFNTNEHIELFFPDFSNYRYSIYAVDENGQYGDAATVFSLNCDCYEGINTTTYFDDKEIVGPDGNNRYFIRYTNGANINGDPDTFLNYVWTYPEGDGWEMTNYEYFKTNITPGAGSGNVTVKVVDVCTGEESATLSIPVVGIRADQTITFDELSSKKYGDGNFTLAATSNSGLSITYESSNTDVATVSGSNVSIIGVGSTNFTASQAGDDDYNPASDVIQGLTVGKGDQTIIFNTPAAKTFGDANFILAGSASSGLAISWSSSNTSAATVNSSTGEVTVVGVGTTSISANQSGNSNYSAASSILRSLVIVKANQTIAFDGLDTKVYGDEEFTLDASSSSELSVSYVSSNLDVATVSGNTVTIVGAGSSTITASQGGNISFNQAANVPQTLTVNKASQSIAFGELASKIFGDATFDLTATAGSGLAVSFASSDLSIATVSGNTVTIVGAGTTTITASQGGNDNIAAASNVQQFLIVNQASQAITFGALASKTFGDATFNLTATASSGLGVSYESADLSVATVSGNTVTIVGAGTTTITASQDGNDDVVAASSVPQSLIVNQASQSITFGALASKTFGDATFNLTASASSDLGVSYESSDLSVATVSGSTVTIVGAGTTTITASQDGNNDFAAASNIPQSLSVNQADQTITFDALANKTFGVATFDLTAKASSGLGVSYESSNLSVATVSGNTVTVIGAGSTTITASQGGSDNYIAAADKEQTLTINKSGQTITLEAIADKEIASAAFEVDASASSDLDVTFLVTGPAEISGTTITLNGTEGTVTVTVSQSGNSNYHAASDAEVSFEVVASLPSEQSITFETLDAVTFGDDEFDLVATSSSGLSVTYTLSDEDVATISGETVTIIGAGETIITALQAGNEDFYAATSVEQTLIVNKNSQIINFETIDAVTFGDDDFDLTASSSSGLSLIYTSSDEDVATILGKTVTIVGAGETLITASQAGNEDYYVATSVEQTLTVGKKSQTITFDQIADRSMDDGVLVLHASASSELDVSFELVSGSASILDNEVSFDTDGLVTVLATQVGNENFEAASSVEQTVTVVSQVVSAIDGSSNAIYIYPNPVTDRLTIRSNHEPTLELMDLSGKVLIRRRGKVLDMSAVMRGNYIVRVISGGEVLIKHIVKN